LDIIGDREIDMGFILETLGEVGEAWLILVGVLLMVAWSQYKAKR